MDLKDKKRDYQINSLEFAREFIEVNHPKRKIHDVIPYAFTIGSSNNGENLPTQFKQPNALFFGFLTLCVNPNENVLQDEVIKIKYQSYFNVNPYYKHINRIVEQENLINEITTSIELFDDIELVQASQKYECYLTFTGYMLMVY